MKHSHSDLTSIAAPRQIAEACSLRIGLRVTVSPSFRYAADWPGEYVIVGLAWEYQHGAGREINVTIASDDDIAHRHGPTDGFAIGDLVPVIEQLNTSHRPEEPRLSDKPLKRDLLPGEMENLRAIIAGETPLAARSDIEAHRPVSK